jgi:hypothetical protein
MNEDLLTDCYNCTGEKTVYVKGKPQLGCILCKNYGNNKGKLYKKYRNEQVEIHSNMDKINLVEVFTPPSYECVTCKDSLKANYRIWMKKREDPRSYEKSFYNMPVIELPCHKCNPKVHTKLREEKELELDNNAEIKM